MVLKFLKICRSALPLVLVVVTGVACGDPQLNQSRREPLFVGQEFFSAAYAPGLIVVSKFPNLNPSIVENPRFVSSNPSVATASVISGDRYFGFNVGGSAVPAVRLNTGAQGAADIMLFDDEELIHTESIRVSLPASWRFDFTAQNQFAPSEAALHSDETIQILERGQVLGAVEFSRTAQFAPEDIIVGTGRIDVASDLILDVRPDPGLPVGAGTDVLRFNQLTTGDLVWMISASFLPSVSLELPNGATLFASGLTVVPRFSVEELEVIVTEQPRYVEDAPADVAVYGRTESGRVLGLAPVVTLDGVPLLPFFVDFTQELTWLFYFDPMP